VLTNNSHVMIPSLRPEARVPLCAALPPFCFGLAGPTAFILPPHGHSSELPSSPPRHNTTPLAFVSRGLDNPPNMQHSRWAPKPAPPAAAPAPAENVPVQSTDTAVANTPSDSAADPEVQELTTLTQGLSTKVDTTIHDAQDKTTVRDNGDPAPKPQDVSIGPNKMEKATAEASAPIGSSEPTETVSSSRHFCPNMLIISQFGSGTSYDDATAAFAQTASADDLFYDDDVVPVEQPVIEQHQLETPAATTPATAANGHGNSGGQQRGTGYNGRGGGYRGRGGGYHQRKIKTKTSQEEDEASAAKLTSSDSPTKESLISQSVGKGYVAAAGGDRSLTGGPPKKPRLKDDSPELATLMANAAKKNAERTARFEREQADLAKAEAREAAALKRNEELKVKRVEKAKIERQNRAEMMGEREKNARRKLEAAGVREWDREKGADFQGTEKPGRIAPAGVRRTLEKKGETVSLPSPAFAGSSWADQVEEN
jgi:hypothetical protein